MLVRPRRRPLAQVAIVVVAIGAVLAITFSIPVVSKSSVIRTVGYPRLIVEPGAVSKTDAVAVVQSASPPFIPSFARGLSDADTSSTSLDLPCPLLWQDAPYRPKPRLVVISLGGVGTTSLMEALRRSLRAINYDLNAIPDSDYLKHAPFSFMTRNRMLRRPPTGVIYLVGDPLVGIESHFRRGWAGFQFCKVAPDGTAQLRMQPELYRLFLENNGAQGNLTTFARFASVVAETRTDPFRTWEHAASWVRGAAELGLPVWFTTLEHLVANQSRILRFLGAPNATMPPLVLEARRNATGSPGRAPLPQAAVALYGRIRDRLLEALEGTCVALGSNASMHAHQRCLAAGLPLTVLPEPGSTACGGEYPRILNAGAMRMRMYDERAKLSARQRQEARLGRGPPLPVIPTMSSLLSSLNMTAGADGLTPEQIARLHNATRGRKKEWCDALWRR